MPISAETSAFAILCRPNGAVIEVIYDELGLKPGRDFFSLVHESSLRKAKRFLRTAVASHAALDWELIVRLPDGRVPFFFSASITGRGIIVIGMKDPASSAHTPKSMIEGAGHHAEALAPALQEIEVRKKAKAHARKRLRTGLDRLNKALEEPADMAASRAEREKPLQLIRMLAHDLRNPLSGILAASQYLIEDASPLLDGQQVTLLRSIESSSSQMLRLIEDMLQASSAAPKKRGVTTGS